MVDKKNKYNIRFISMIIACFTAICFAVSCSDDDDKIDFTEEALTIKEMIDEGSLLLDAKREGENTRLTFETGSLLVPSDGLSYEIDKDNWNTVLVLDGYTFNVPTLGESFTPNFMRVNPTGYAPLTLRLQYYLMVEGKLEMRIKSKDDNVPDITHQFSKYGEGHVIDVHGLYPDYLNTVYITLTDKNGKKRLTDTIEVQTEDISKIINTTVKAVKADPSKMEPGLVLVSYIGGANFDAHRPYMIDALGNTRWLLALKDHPILKSIVAGNGFKRLRNGNFIAGSRDTDYLYEIDMVGNVLNEWNIGKHNIGFHHDIIELPNNNFMFTATKYGDKKADGSAASMDYVIELDRSSGNIITEWDLKQSLDETRDLLRVDQTASNWAHGNGILYLEDEDAILVSTRFQGFVKLTRQNHVKWIFSPQRGFVKNRWGDNLKNYLLNPLDAQGNLIENEDVKEGYVPAETFDWNWTSHSPRFLPNGNLLVYDNGYMRHYERNQNNGYSRVVEYKIDESNGTVQQVWQYGKERGNECYSYAGGSAEYLPKTGNILFAGGMNTQNSGGKGGRIIELNPKTNEIVRETEINVFHKFAFQCAVNMSLYPN